MSSVSINNGAQGSSFLQRMVLPPKERTNSEVPLLQNLNEEAIRAVGREWEEGRPGQGNG